MLTRKPFSTGGTDSDNNRRMLELVNVLLYPIARPPAQGCNGRLATKDTDSLCRIRVEVHGSGSFTQIRDMHASGCKSVAKATKVSLRYPQLGSARFAGTFRMKRSSSCATAVIGPSGRWPGTSA
jgi:hypothetical protein